MTKKLMLLVKRPDGTVAPIPVDDRIEAEAVIEITRIMMNRDITGTPVEIEIVEVEDTPL